MKGMPTGNKRVNKHPRFHHDFSARRAYTTKAGLIDISRCIDLVPDEHVNIDVSDFLQSMPRATAAFLRGRREHSFYFVPYHQLWQNFGQYMSRRDDPYSSALKGRLYEPRIALRDMVAWCAQSMLISAHKNRSELPTIGDATFLAENWNAKVTFTWTNSDSQSRSFEVDLTSYLTHSTWKKVENRVVSDFTPTRKVFALDRFNLDRWSNWCRKLDKCRYGNYIPVLSPLYDDILAIVGSEIEGTQAQFASKMEYISNRIKRMLDAIPSNYYVSPFRILAYNKLFYTYFRNSFYDLDYYVGDYNVDHLDCDSLASSVLDNSMFSLYFMDMYQHQWKKDMFTSLMPDTQFGAVSEFEVHSIEIEGDGTKIGELAQLGVGVLGNNGIELMRMDEDSFADSSGDMTYLRDDVDPTKAYLDALDDSSHVHVKPVNLRLDNGRVNAVNGSILGLGITSVGDVLALKRAEAIQRYRQTLLRCGNKTKDIMLGLYGVEPVWESDHDPAFIDAFGYDFSVDRVVSTAQTNAENNSYDGKLGDLGGYIAKLGSNKHSIKYTTHGDFGVLMCLDYNILESEYNSYNIDKNNLTLTPEDRYIWDYQDLGFVPVTRRLLSNLPQNIKGTNSEDLDQVLGYGTPYFEKKIDIDLVHGILCIYDSPTIVYGSEASPDYFGDFSHWVTPRTDMQSALVSLVKNFYIDPRILNGNFLLAADGRQESDQFICNTYFRVSRTNTISDLGLPKF